MGNKGHIFVKLLTATAAILVGCTVFFGCGSSGSPPSNASASPAAANNRGREIVDEYLRRDAAPFRKSRVRFTSKEADDPEKVFEIDSWRKQTPGETSTLTVIASPPEDAGIGSLTIEASGKKTVVVAYSMARNEFVETDTKKMFFSGLTAGELLGEWDKFDFKFIGEKDLAGVKTLEVDGKLKANIDSAIARINVLFRADNYVPVELHLFGSDGMEMRVYKTTAIKDDPQHPYASRMEVENRVYKSRIVIEVLKREFPSTIDDSMFAREKLKASVRK